MYGLKRTGLFSQTGVSMAGGVAHNTGQLLVAALIVSNIKLFVYFPVLLFSGLDVYKRQINHLVFDNRLFYDFFAVIQ